MTEHGKWQDSLRGVTQISTPICYAALVASLILNLIISAYWKAELDFFLLAALFWIATGALAWHRWIKRSVAPFARAAAAIAVALMSLTIYRWIPQTDVFIVCTRGCPPRTGSIWPLVFIWLATIGFLSFVVWGRWEKFVQGRYKLSVLSAVWYMGLTVWTVACGYVLIKNLSWDVVRVSALTSGRFVGAIVGIVGGFALLVFLLSIPHRRRTKQAIADFERIDQKARQEWMQMIDSYSRSHEYLLLYRPETSSPIQTASARIGGDPASMPNEGWPKDADGKDGIFLLQLPLVSSRLLPPWAGRLLTIFLVDYELVIRSYDITQQTFLAALSNPSPQAAMQVSLVPMAIPYIASSVDSDKELDEFDAGYLLTHIPGLQAAISAHTKYPGKILGRLLNTTGDGEVSSELEILVGGDPRLIQSEHSAVCPTCKEPMRFLLQFCDVTTDYRMGDCGVGYIYGCNAHPEHCEGFIDCF